MTSLNQTRILLVDDNIAIHQDFRKILSADAAEGELKQAEAALFGDTLPAKNEKKDVIYTIDSAHQGQEAIELVKKAVVAKQPYSLAFVDIRMPPGLDGIATIKQIWNIDPNIQIVICTAYSDYSWEDIQNQLGESDGFLILKKPFDVVEIRQLVTALTKKWELKQQVQFQIENLNALVKKRTSALQKALSLTKATLESTPEGIIAVSCRGETVVYNKEFLKIWKVSEDYIKTKKANAIFQYLSIQMEDPPLFFAAMTAASEDNPKEENGKAWKLKNGQVLEVSAHPQFLHGHIIGTVFSFRDISDQKRLEEQLLYQATHDSLTNLPNRILFYDRMHQAIAYAKRYNLYMGVLFFDLDNFKQVNDSLGHRAGDLLLRSVAKRLISCVRECDTVTRIGGDEFVVVLGSQTSEEDFVSRANEMLETFVKPFKFENQSLKISASIGISIYPRDGEDIETLLKNADIALYYAKEKGRNNYQFYLPELVSELQPQRESLEKV